MTRAPNTFLAHRVVKAAEAQGHGDAAMNAIFSGHFEHGVDIGNLDALDAWLRKSGVVLDLDPVRAGAFTDEVRADEALARELGVSGVPFFLSPETKRAISGAREPELLAQLF
jgi:predicted DsbA family dithiol-disulfide isomerase